MDRRHFLLGLALGIPAWRQGLAAAPARAPTRRLIALGPGALRMVTYLGATDLLVGCEDIERRPLTASTYRLALPRQVLALPSLGPGGPGRMPDLEQLLGLGPDLAVSVTLDAQQIQSLRQRAGIEVLPLSYGDTGILREEALVDSLRRLGATLGRERRASELGEYLTASIADLRNRLAGQPPVAAYLGGVSLSGAHGITSTQAGHRPLVWAGARNLADQTGRTGHLFLDREQLLAWDPPLLFVDGGGLPGILAEYAKDAAFYQRLRAVREGRVYLALPFNAYNTNVENALANAWFMAKVLHPRAMAEVDVQARAADILRAFLGADLLPALAKNGHGLGRLDLATGTWKPLS